ncbi:DUF429 domain-containing protein [Halobacteriales archaeon SW_8_65_20]|nr:MAG: DUF429 domain-containing protein [Halobacteriales archaeon SW_8_65_20]
MALFVGTHWTGEQWVATAFADGYESTTVYEEIGRLWSDVADDAERVLVDVPVGLVEEGKPTREPDELTRSVVGDRADEVVTPPVREATRKRRYPAAARVMERKTGQSLSERAFTASEPIAAVDELLQEIPETRGVFGESHAELCFRAFAGAPLAHDRRRAGGYAERMRALAEFDPDAPPTVQAAAEAVAGHAVRIESVLDALALGYTARPGSTELRTLPATPETDATGLQLCHYYRAADPVA